MKNLKILIAAICGMMLSSCVSTFVARALKPTTVELVSSATPAERYNNVTRGLNLAVTSKVSNSIVDNSELDAKTRKMFEKATVTVEPTVRLFVETSMSSYIKRMGIKVNNDNHSDYRLRVDVTEFKVVRGTSAGRAVVVMEYTLSNNDNEQIFRKTARGSYSSAGSVVDAMDKAYGRALENMDWQGIADALTTHSTARQENNRQVTGNGDTALEHTVIRWFIDSKPQGADVSWRVVSSTPEVKNTNSTYVGTTPYETTESFDIRGLTYETSGNVQIEVTCEKPGYLTQKRRFNLRQAIDQREISAKFNLVKDEE